MLYCKVEEAKARAAKKLRTVLSWEALFQARNGGKNRTCVRRDLETVADSGLPS